MASKDDSVFGKLVDAFQEQRDAERQPKLSDAVLPSSMSSMRVIKSEYLPPNTIMASPDVWEMLKRYCDERMPPHGNSRD